MRGLEILNNFPLGDKASATLPFDSTNGEPPGTKIILQVITDFRPFQLDLGNSFVKRSSPSTEHRRGEL